MATSVTPTSFKKRAPPFACVADEDVQSAIDEAGRWVSESAWGPSRYDDGIFYFAAHILEENEALRDTVAGESAGEIPAGPVISERILDWGATYARSDDAGDVMSTTVWGRRYLQRCKLVFANRCL